MTIDPTQWPTHGAVIEAGRVLLIYPRESSTRSDEVMNFARFGSFLLHMQRTTQPELHSTLVALLEQ